MAIADRLNKLRTDIEDTYQAINEIGGTIPSDKNTNNIPEAIRSVYDNLPKVSDTGTNVSLSPTLKGRLGIVPKGNTLQDGEPTPDTPVEIQSATGTQNVVVSGKNLFDENYPSLSETLKYLPIYVGNGTFTMSSNVPENVVVGASLFFLTGNVTSGASTSANGVYKDRPITINSTNGYVTVAYRNYNDPNNYDTQIEKGNTATPYQPYQEPQEVDIELGNIELNKIGVYEDYIGGTPDNWVLYKKTRKISLNISDMNNAENYPGWKNISIIKEDYPDSQSSLNGLCNITLTNKSPSPIIINTKSTNAIIYLNPNIFALTQTQWKEQYPNLTFKLVYGLQEYEQTPITEEPLVSQLNELYYLQSYNDTTNIDVTGNLPMRITASAIKGA